MVKTKKILSLLLTMTMVLSLHPAFTAMASTDAAISNPTGFSPKLAQWSIDPDPDASPKVSSPSLEQCTTAWFGGYKWIIIGWDGAGIASPSGTATLFLANENKNKPDDIAFNPTTLENQYAGSTLQTAMKSFFSDKITDEKEKNTILSRNLEGGSGNFSYIEEVIPINSFKKAAGDTKKDQYIGGYHLHTPNTFNWYAYHNLRILDEGFIGEEKYTGSYHPDKVAGKDAGDNSLWPLSVAEASLLDPSIREYSGSWWLRSPGEKANTAAQGVFQKTVNAQGLAVNLSQAVRPAFHLNLDSILFMSAAVGGKSSAELDAGLIPANPIGTDLKFTILDTYDADTNPNGLSLTVPEMTLTAKVPGESISIPYENATIGTDLYVSGVLADDNGNIQYYGKFADASASPSGDATFDLPADIPVGQYTLKLFVEQVNGDYETDFASTPVEIPLEVTKRTATVTFNGISPNTATYGDPVTFTATVTGGGATPTGTVAFTNSSNTLGSKDLADGVATFTIDILAAGKYDHVIAEYSGDENYESAVSAPAQSLTINKAVPDIATKPTASNVQKGQTLKNSTLTGGAAKSNGKGVPGTFIWVNNTVAVSKSGEFDATFMPKDANNFESVTPIKVSVTAISGDSGSGGGGGGGSSTTHYTVTFHSNGGSAVSTQSVTQGAMAIKPASPAKEGFAFAGWFSDSALTKEYSFKAAVTGNLTLYAKWEASPSTQQNIPDPAVPQAKGVLSFTDVLESNWFYDHVHYVWVNNIFSGTSDTTFNPNMPMTRGMLVTALWRMAESPAANDIPFGDVTAGQYYSQAVAWAAKNDIVSGMGDGSFAPGAEITREQMAAILWRYTKFMNRDVSISETTNILSYNDASDVSAYAMDALQWACGAGIISGKPGELLDPQGSATRAEVAAMLHRFIESAK